MPPGMRRRRGPSVVGVAVGASAVSSAKKNSAERKAIENQNQQAQGATTQPVADPTEELKKYKDLLDQGILTQEEFDAKKKELLNL